MTRSVDLELLRRVTADAICVYEAIRRAKTLTTEGEHVLALADDLLRQAGLAYLLEGVELKLTDNEEKGRNAPEEMISNYIQIQQAYADLKDALYRLAKTKVEEKRWKDAQVILDALWELEPKYRDVALLLRQSYLQPAETLFHDGKWEEGRAVLKTGLARYPKDKAIRVRYLYSFVEEGTISALRSLQSEEPDVSKLPSFELVIRYLIRLDAIEREINANIYGRPSCPIYGFEKFEEYEQKVQEYKRKNELYNQELVRLQRDHILTCDKLSDAYEQLTAEIASLINASEREE